MKKDMAVYGQQLLNIARVQQKDPGKALDLFLDYLIGVFDVENIINHDCDFVKIFEDAKKENEALFMLMFDWINKVTTAMENGGWLDFFGEIYEEMFKGKMKATGLGQFFTPDSLCDLMAAMTVNKDDDSLSAADCACGSGRTLLAAWAKMDKSKFHRFDAADIDYISCKMCALNMMIHGMIGEVRQQDSLRLDNPSVVYVINEIRYPIPCSMYSIRIITNY